MNIQELANKLLRSHIIAKANSDVISDTKVSDSPEADSIDSIFASKIGARDAQIMTNMTNLIAQAENKQYDIVNFGSAEESLKVLESKTLKDTEDNNLHTTNLVTKIFITEDRSSLVGSLGITQVLKHNNIDEIVFSADSEVATAFKNDKNLINNIIQNTLSIANQNGYDIKTMPVRSDNSYMAETCDTYLSG